MEEVGGDSDSDYNPGSKRPRKRFTQPKNRYNNRHYTFTGHTMAAVVHVYTAYTRVKLRVNI